MKQLCDLHPKLVGLLRPCSGEGILFDCPKCGPGHRLAVYFDNPIDGQPPAAWQTPKWVRTGESFEELTIEPSIQYPCFHGWVEDGQVIDIGESRMCAVMVIDGVRTLVALSPRQEKAAMDSSI